MTLRPPAGLTRRALRRGLLGGHRGWQVGLVILVVIRLVGRVAKTGRPPVVHSERLRVGERLEIVHLGGREGSETASPPTGEGSS